MKEKQEKIKSFHKGKGQQPSLVGETKELGNKVYTYGYRNQGDWYNKTTEAIGDLAGRTISKEMRVLIMQGKETDLKEPTKPTGTVDEYTLAKYKAELDRYYDKQEKYKKKYGQVVHDLNNNHLVGGKNYPVTVEKAVTLLANYKQGDNKGHKSDEHEEKTVETSFAQGDDDSSVAESMKSARSSRSDQSSRTHWYKK